MLNKLKSTLLLAVLSLLMLSGIAVSAEDNVILVNGTDTYTSNIAEAKTTDPTLVLSTVTSGSGSGNSGVKVLAGSNTAINTNALYKENFPDGIWFTYEFQCTVPGYYEVTVETGYDNLWESPYSYGVDGTLYSVSDEGFGDKRTYYHTGWNLFYLTEGKHTFTYRIDGCAWSAKRVFGNFFQAKFVDVTESITAVENKIDEIGTVTADKKDLIEECRTMYDALSSGAKKYVSNAEKLLVAEAVVEQLVNGTPSTPIQIAGKDYSSKSASLNYTANTTSTFPGGDIVQFTASSLPDDGFSITYDFVVTQTGTYRLDLSSAYHDNQYLSDYAISVDDGKKNDINSKTIETMNAHPNSGSGYAQYLRRYKTNLMYELEQGLHTVTIHLTSERAVTSGSKVYLFHEYLKFVLDEEVSDATFTDDVVYAEIGDGISGDVSFIGATSGATIANSDLSGNGATIEYNSSNSNVAKLDIDNNLIAVGFGEATVSADVTYKNSTFNPQMTIRTTVDGVYVGKATFGGANGNITSLSKAGNKLTVKTPYVYKSQDSKTVYIILAVFDKNGVMTKYKKQDCTLSATGDLQAEITDFAYSDGMRAEVFVWGDANIPKLMSVPEEIK